MPSLLAATGSIAPARGDPADRLVPDGEEVFTRWATMGVAHFGELGAEVEPVLVRDRAGADDPAAAAGDRRGGPDLPVGRQAGYLLDALAGSAVGTRAGGRARARGGARRLLRRGDGPGRRTRSTSGSGSLPWPLRWRSGLGFAPGASVVPHYDAWPEALSRADRAAVAARLGRARHRRGDGRRRPRRVVAGPRPFAGHGLAGAPPRAASGRRASFRSRHLPARTPAGRPISRA